MPTCREIITQALRMSKVIAAGEQPEASESADGLFVLQGMYDQWVTAGAFGLMKDVYKTDDYTAKENETVITLGSPTITVPDLYAEDGSEGSQRAPLDLALIQIYDRTAQTYQVSLYDRFEWVSLVGLTLNNAAPLATRGQDGLAACLAIRYAEQFGDGTITRAIITLASQFRSAFGNKRVDARSSEPSYY